MESSRIPIYKVLILFLIICVFSTSTPIEHIETYSPFKDFQQQVYVINLDRRPERLQNFESELSKSDLSNDYFRIQAVDGASVDLNAESLSVSARDDLIEVDKLGYRNKHYQLTKGAIGCYKSHIKVWKQIISDTDVDVALVFEDDTKIPHNLQQLINTKMQHAPTDWDIVLLGISCHSCSGISENKDFLKVNRFWLFHAYLINRKSIQKIFDAEVLYPITQQIDSLLSDVSNDINIYALASNPVRQNTFQTDIQAPVKEKAGVDTMISMNNFLKAKVIN